MGDIGVTTNDTAEANGHEVPQGKKQILLNAFDMSTVGHLSPGQWKVSNNILTLMYSADIDPLQNPKDKSATKRKLDYWVELAQLLERGGINALFLADTYGGYDTYQGKLDECIRRAAQWPVTDPTIVCSFLFMASDYKGTDCLAHLCHGCCDQEPGLRNHVVDLV